MKLGIYKHFKGNEYEVITIAKDSETQEEMVVYRALYGKRDVWVRPLKMFIEKIKKDNYEGSRFVWMRKG
jgi:hypothetical protein